MDVEIAARLLEYRKKNGYSQEELAEKIGVSRQAISKWERSESSPDTDNLIALSKLYSISIDELINGKTESEPVQDKVNIGFKGIDVQSADGDRVHVGIDGIRVNEGSGAEKDAFKYEEEEEYPAAKAVILIVGIIAFLLTGFLFKWWAFSWTFILFALCIMSLVDAVAEKKPSHFNYPVLMVAIFCLVGITADIWHPTWVLFVTIPLYYLICDAFKKNT